MTDSNRPRAEFQPAARAGSKIAPMRAAPEPLELDDAPAVPVPLVPFAPDRVAEPPPVRLVAIEDVRLLAPPEAEAQLDALYAGVLGMRRRPADEFHLFYEAQNACLVFQTHRRPVIRENMDATGVEVPSLRDLAKRLDDLRLGYERQIGLTPGEEAIVLVDAGGNWLTITERRGVA